MMSSAGEVI